MTVDHVALARHLDRGGVEGYRAACACGWTGPEYTRRDFTYMAEARTSALMCAERHVVRHEQISGPRSGSDRPAADRGHGAAGRSQPLQQTQGGLR